MKKDVSNRPNARTPERLNASGPAPSTSRLIADGLAVMWVVVVGAQYALVLLVPGAPDVSASYPALLAGVGIAGIMSYLKSQRKVVNREC